MTRFSDDFKGTIGLFCSCVFIEYRNIALISKYHPLYVFLRVELLRSQVSVSPIARH
jgi:hypothetical protein